MQLGDGRRATDGRLPQRDAPASGALTGVGSAYSGTVDLTSEGTLDWAAWGATSVSDAEHKASGGGLISDWSVVGGGTVYGYGNSYNSRGPIGFTWTDGTPTSTQTTPQYSGVWIDSQPNGFAVSVRATPTPHTLRIYVGTAGASGTLTAHLSDSSAPDYVDTKLGSSTGYYTLVFNSAAGSATLTVQWVQSSTAGGDVNLSAAALY